MEVIRTNSASKYFGETPAADGISLHVKQGEIYGFLGLNGAGKTTLIRMLLGMIKPDNGSLHLFGKEVNAGFGLWNDVGYLVETPYAYPNLSVVENLKIYYTLRGLKDPALIDNAIDRLKLAKYRDKKAKYLSLGNQQRLGLAKALMHQPKLLILDEPINGLDPEGIVEVRELLKELAANGSTIFLSSHILGEISKLANRIGIIHAGKLIKELSTPELSELLNRKLIIEVAEGDKAIAVLTTAGYTVSVNTAGQLEIFDRKALAHPEKVNVLLVEHGLPPVQLFSVAEDLEMYFLRTIK